MQNIPAASNSLSLVIPMYEEADNVAPILAQVHAGLREYSGPWELICVDDGSRDGTGEHLRKQAADYGSHVRIIELRRNFGQTAAMQAGLDAARGSLIATLDGDLQNDPADIPRMVQELMRRDLDLLQGWRLERRDGLLLRKIPSRIANWLIAKVTGVHLHDYGCSLKLYRAEVIKPVRLFGEMHRLIPVWVAGVTDPRRIGETVVRHEARRFGASKYGISRILRVLPDLLAASFFLRYGTRPGHFFGAIGMGLGFIGTLIMLHLLVVKFGLGEDIGNRPLLFVGILFLVASIQIFTTGVLAELLARSFFASRDQPDFTIARQGDPDQAGWRRSE